MDEEIYSSTYLGKKIKKLLRRPNNGLTSLVDMQLKTQLTKEIIKTLMQKICHYGIRMKIFNYPI